MSGLPKNNSATNAAYQGSADGTSGLESALSKSLSLVVLIAVVSWVIYKKYIEELLPAKKPVYKGGLWATGAGTLTLANIPHQFRTREFFKALIASLLLLLMYSAAGFCFGWVYRTLRPTALNTALQRCSVGTAVNIDSTRQEARVLTSSRAPLVKPGQAVKPSTEEDHWATALAELEDGVRRQGVWAKAFADSDGDDIRTKVAYLKARVQQLTAPAVDS